MLITRSALAQTYGVQPESRQTQGMAAALLLALCLALPHAMAAASEAPMMLALTSASAQPQVQAASQQRSVDLNSASAEQLASTLVGVGAAKAQAIIRYRDEVGPFRSVEELEEVKGIGPNTVTRNKARISVTNPKG